MNDASAAAPAATSAPTTTTATAPVVAAPPAAPVAAPTTAEPSGDDVKLPRLAFNERIASARAAERAALLKELGIADPSEVQSLLADKRAREDAAKTAEQKALEKDAALKTEQERTARLLATIRQRSEVELAGLTDERRQAVVTAAGDDPAERLRLIDAFKPTWATQDAPPAPAAPSPVAAAPTVTPPTAPANTAPRPAAPPDGGQSVVIDHRAEYERRASSNPFAAAVHGNRHAVDVYLRKS